LIGLICDIRNNITFFLPLCPSFSFSASWHNHLCSAKRKSSGKSYFLYWNVPFIISTLFTLLFLCSGYDRRRSSHTRFINGFEAQRQESSHTIRWQSSLWFRW
jgi:hypothetical protein